MFTRIVYVKRSLGLSCPLARIQSFPWYNLRMCAISRTFVLRIAPIDIALEETEEMNQTFLTTEEVASLLRLRKNYLERLRCTGGGPPFIRASRRRCLYRREDVLNWVNERRFANTCTLAPA